MQHTVILLLVGVLAATASPTPNTTNTNATSTTTTNTTFSTNTTNLRVEDLLFDIEGNEIEHQLHKTNELIAEIERDNTQIMLQKLQAEQQQDGSEPMRNRRRRITRFEEQVNQDREEMKRAQSIDHKLKRAIDKLKMLMAKNKMRNQLVELDKDRIQAAEQAKRPDNMKVQVVNSLTELEEREQAKRKAAAQRRAEAARALKDGDKMLVCDANGCIMTQKANVRIQVKKPMKSDSKLVIPERKLRNLFDAFFSSSN